MNMNMMRSLTGVLMGLLVTVNAAVAQVVTPESIIFDENSIRAKIAISEQVEVDLTVEFESVVGLNANNFEITAQMLSPTDLAITQRLSSTLISATSAFPVIVSIKPKPDAGFAFEGVASVELYTKALHYTPETPLRLFRSHANGTFEDITLLTAPGSIRARGNTGSFSDFMIMLDLRTAETVIKGKMDALTNFLLEHRYEINSQLLDTIDADMSLLSSALSINSTDTALAAIDTLIATIEASNGNTMPDVWRSSDDLVNVKGELLTRLYTLRYSLRVL